MWTFGMLTNVIATNVSVFSVTEIFGRSNFGAFTELVLSSLFQMQYSVRRESGGV